MTLLKKKNQSVIGLDVGSREIKAVELTRSGAGYAVSRLASKPLNSRESAVDVLRELSSEADFSTTRVVCSVSGRSVVVRYISMQRMNPEELRTMMKYEAGKHIPFGIDEVVIDCQNLDLPSVSGRAEADMKVLLVAAKRGFVAEHVKRINQAGYNTVIVDVDAFALGNAYNFSRSIKAGDEPAKNTGIVDIGASKTSINISCGDSSMFTREIYLGGDEFTNAISRQRGLSVAEAEEFKTSPDTALDELEEVVSMTAEDLGNEIQMSFDYFENQFETGVNEVLLTGGGALLRGLENAFEERFQRPTRIWNPLAETPIQAGYEPRMPESAGPKMAVALGLASRLSMGKC